MRPLGIFAGVIAALIVASVAVARPPAPLALSLNLNGEARRPVQADGGGLILSSAGTTVATATIECGRAHKVVCPTTAVNFCSYAIDAGCSSNVSSPQYGEPIAEGDFIYWVANDCTSGLRTVAAVSQTDAGVSCPIFEMY
jgi:hypothetical protein